MKIQELLEADTIYKRGGGKGGTHKGRVQSRKFRCMSGPRKGRIVANISTCHAPVKVDAKQKMTITRARAPKKAAWHAKMTKKSSAVSRTVAGLNKAKGTHTPKPIKRAKKAR